MLRHIGLDQTASGDRFAARAPGYLVQELEGPLSRAGVGLCQAKVCVDHADQREPREVMALGDELRADDHVHLALLDLAQGLAQVGDAGCQVAGQQHAARIGEALGDLLGDAFDAGTAGHERMLGAAMRALLRDGDELTAMMAFEPAPEPVLNEPGRAVRAFELEAAFAADGDRRIAAPVQEQESLLSTP